MILQAVEIFDRAVPVTVCFPGDSIQRSPTHPFLLPRRPLSLIASASALVSTLIAPSNVVCPVSGLNQDGEPRLFGFFPRPDQDMKLRRGALRWLAGFPSFPFVRR